MYQAAPDDEPVSGGPGADPRSLVRPGGPFGELLEGFVVMEPARQAT
ncbi:MAG TPA: hypothetical protein VGG75_24265 [Trebonia sp.]